MINERTAQKKTGTLGSRSPPTMPAMRANRRGIKGLVWTPDRSGADMTSNFTLLGGNGPRGRAEKMICNDDTRRVCRDRSGDAATNVTPEESTHGFFV